jgi:hypothetical protein
VPLGDFHIFFEAEFLDAGFVGVMVAHFVDMFIVFSAHQW